MNGFQILGGLAVGGAALAAALMLALQRAYRRHLEYDPKRSCVAGFAGAGIEVVSLQCDSNGFRMPDLNAGVASGFIEMEVRASICGSFRDPGVEIEARGMRDMQILERGVRGIRFLNVTRLLATGIAAGETVALRGRHLAWRPEFARLHVCRERLRAGERVLVIAPHPDDAEIAAFGLYADSGATVVTITAGDSSDRYTGGDGEGLSLTRATIARMRVWDSIAVPHFGGIGPEKALNLCYPDGQLQAMHAQRTRDFRAEGEDSLDFSGLRLLNHSPLVREGAACSWDSLVGDLSHILAETKPTIIVTPHPWLDPVPDHSFATAAVCEAVRTAGLTEGRFYCYVNHNRRSELWPFGPSGSGVALLPMFPDDVVECDGF